MFSHPLYIHLYSFFYCAYPIFQNRVAHPHTSDAHVGTFLYGHPTLLSLGICRCCQVRTIRYLSSLNILEYLLVKLIIFNQITNSLNKAFFFYKKTLHNQKSKKLVLKFKQTGMVNKNLI